MRVLFCTSDRIASRIIRAVTWSDWSHVAIIDGYQVIEAVWPEVRAAHLSEVLAKHPSYAIVHIPVPDEQAAIAAARSQIGKPYDLVGMLGLGLHRDWQQDTDWWCSELVTFAIQAGGMQLYRDNVMHKVTPQHLWMLNFQAANKSE